MRCQSPSARSIRDAARELSKVRSILGEVGTSEFDQLLALLDRLLLDGEGDAELEQAVVQWQVVREQIETRLARRTLRERFLKRSRGS